MKATIIIRHGKKRLTMKTEKKQICVIGAGVSGLTAAGTLQEKGHTVTVLEKNDRTGGKCHTQYYDDIPHEMGAVVISPSYQTIIRLARSVKAVFGERTQHRIIKRHGELKNFRQHYWPWKKSISIIREMIVYTFYALLFAIRHERKGGYRNLKGDYTLTFGDFCRKKNLNTIMPWFEMPVASFGYGDLNDIKAWYVFHYIHAIHFIGIAFFIILFAKDSPDSLINQKSSTKTFLNGHEDFMKKLGEKLDIRYSSAVTNIKRSKNGVRITLAGGENTPDEVITCDTVVLSIPLPQLISIMDYSKDELKLAKDMGIYQYAIITCRVEGLSEGSFLILGNSCRERSGHLNMISKPENETGNIYTCYINDQNSKRTRSDIIEGLTKDLNEMGAKLVSVKDFRQWQYFPHFNNPDSFNLLHTIQGQHNTFYVGAMAKFETTESVASHAEYIADRHFTGKRKKESFSRLKNLQYLYS